MTTDVRGSNYRYIRYCSDEPAAEEDMTSMVTVKCASGVEANGIVNPIYPNVDNRVLKPGRYAARVVNAFVDSDSETIFVMDLIIEEGEFAGMRLRKAYRLRSGAAKTFWAKEAAVMGVSAEGDATVAKQWVELVGMELIIRVDIQVNGNVAVYVVGRVEEGECWASAHMA